MSVVARNSQPARAGVVTIMTRLAYECRLSIDWRI